MTATQAKTPTVNDAFIHAFNSATKLMASGKKDEARQKYKTCAREAPEVWFGIGCKAMQDGLRAEAYNIFLDVLEYATKHQTQALALNNLGFLKMHYGQRNTAERYFQQSIALHPCPANWVNYGILLSWLGRNDEAMKLYAKAIQKDPACPSAHFSRAMILLKNGNFREGWQEYTARFDIQGSSSRRMESPHPEWDGKSVKGKHVMIYPEQGVGDTIHMMRFAPLLKERGADVSIILQKGLRRLATSMKCFKSISEPGETTQDFDLKVPSMELPRLFGIDSIEKIPGKPYIPLPKNHVSLPGKLRIGLVWRGAVHHKQDFMRSCPLEKFRPLFDLPGISWYSFQVGYGEAEMNDAGLPITPVRLVDYYDTARHLAGIDLLISVDTSIVHVAGAMGRPVWMLRAATGDWRWLDRDDSPWYSSMRIFRQEKLQEWSPVIDRIKAELSGLVS